MTTVATAPAWRCPHCRTLQPETSRCRTCSRATVSCSTCVRFRSSVVSGMGFCADDRARSPLTGDEVRSCWTDVVALAGGGLFSTEEEGTSGPTIEAAQAPSEDPPAASVRRGLAVHAGGTGKSETPGLVEAPTVAPARRLRSALERRASERNDAGRRSRGPT